VERARPELLAQLDADRRSRRTVVVATELSSGRHRLIYPFEGTTGVDRDLAATALVAASRDESVAIESGGSEWFLRVQNPALRFFIVGAVHIAQVLAPMARLGGFDVTVVDPREAFATAARFPGITLSHEWPQAALERAALDHRSVVVALSHDPKLDDPALLAALASPAFYVGALGSRKSARARLTRLGAAGATDSQLSRIHGPVGLDIGAVTTSEIATSILAGVVKAARQYRIAAASPEAERVTA
jgi:xanthine dehydrogenase accessory factor